MFLLAGCSFFETSTEPSADFEYSSERLMMHVIPTDVGVSLGTGEKNAKASEMPQMRVKFDYDFFMDTHETTCGDFKRLMPLQMECEDDSLPVSNVTFFDAVLYANARSRAEKMDTAYKYEKAFFDSKGHCQNLEGYVFMPEVEAYRLPTEAEWMLVASNNWDMKNSWTADNSDFILHKVCSKSSSKTGVCDIAGNVMEWVNDWMGSLKDTVVFNYVGPPDGGSSGERIVKGGSFRNLSSSIKKYSRGDVYVVTSGTKTDYVGFRLALGSIPDPTWMDNRGLVKENNIRVLASTQTVRSKLKNYKAKLFFRNDLSGNLAYMDYSDAQHEIVEFKDSLDVYHPDVSPDGKWVAFCTGIEGVPGKSSLYVRSVENMSSKAAKLDVESAAIPRWRVSADGDTVVVYVSYAGDNSDTESFMAASTWQVAFSNGKFGTPEKLFDGAYHGGISDDSRLAVSGSKLFRARVESGVVSDSVVDTVLYNGEQVCNVSLFRDGTKRTSFLDFASATGHKFSGDNSYGVHGRIFIADSTGKLVQSVAAPKGFAFDHSEWVDENLIVATLTNNLGSHSKIVLIDLADSSVTNLLEGDEMWHPCLWTIRNAFKSANVLPYSDSAGAYFREHGQEYMFELRDKMERFWKTKDSVTVAVMGSSRVMFGIHDKFFPDQVVLNMAFAGADLFDANFIIHNYVFNHAKNLKYFIMELAPDMFYRTAAYHWNPIYEENPGYAYDEKHGFWKDGVPDGFLEAVEACPRIEDKSKFAYDRNYQLPSTSWGKRTEFLVDSMTFKNNREPLIDCYAIYKSLVDVATAKGVKVVSVILPRHPGYSKTGMFGAGGPDRSTAKEIIDSVSRMNVILFDENKWGNHDYTDEMAHDYDHLSYLGAEQLSRRLDSLLKTLE